MIGSKSAAWIISTTKHANYNVNAVMHTDPQVLDRVDLTSQTLEK